ncbi:hypothetical protein [Thermodesulforhabdus norvegica]|uniref:Oxaloacetate decarboxylase, gamma chain n=1 Tax=Thermodesulforhabdus norvegica TaxID=39841 RepID=A0A1I4QT92_9BACT|nr:hypothetical protein [Thermodesulforhabdus norvegica]SFM43237.1 hypothetical protein SAMN05660836_00211 [Thermodesulforhabdus norvegica]
MKEAVVIFCNGVVGVFAVMCVLYGAIRLMEILLKLISAGEAGNGD